MIKVHSIVLLFVFAAAPPCLADEPLDTESIISALVEVTNDANEGVRYAAFNALKRQPRSEELVELFWRGLDDGFLQIRGVSLEKIVELEGPTDKVLERLILLTNKRRVAYTFGDDQDANAFLTRTEYRKPWVLPKISEV